MLQPMNIKKLVGIFVYGLSKLIFEHKKKNYIIPYLLRRSSFTLLTIATCYRVAKQFGQAKDYLLKASDCYKENRSLFHAARCYEQACISHFFRYIFSGKSMKCRC